MKPWTFFAASAAALAFGAGACVQRASAPQSGLAQPAVAQETSQTAPIRNASDLAALSATYAQISRRVTPAVVNIQSTTVIPGRVLRDPFSDFFGGDMGGQMLKEPDQQSQSLGSGVIVDASGLIITNNHVIRNATRVNVTLSDQRRFPARILGADPDTDVAVLKIDAPNLPSLKWANSDKLSVGDIVLAVGSPFNLASTVTQGIISAKGRRDLGISPYEDFLQTDAAINPGNSGGALVDINGNLVGINTAILSESGGNQGIGLAIPANLARQIGDQLAKTGRVTRGWLGVVVEPLTGDISDQIGLTGQGGVIVTGVYTNGPAGQLPWSENGTDILLSLNGTRLDSPGQLRNLVAQAAPGATLKLKIWQSGQTREFDVQTARRPSRVQGV
jgi:Do/DeqQ family serine protease